MQFITTSIATVAPLIEQFHYSGRSPRMACVVGAIQSDRGIEAACVFNVPPARWRVPVVELCRLVRHPDATTVSLSSLISSTCKSIRQTDYPKLLISYADNTVAHHGGVYQACSWQYAGFRPPNRDGWIIDGVFVPARTCFTRFGTCGRRLIAMMAEAGRSCVEHLDCGKHLYWRALDRQASRDAATAGLSSKPYPKPAIENALARA